MFRSGVASIVIALGWSLNHHVAQAQNSSPESSDCFATIRSLQEAMNNRTVNLFAEGMMEYILCPDTHFDIVAPLTPSARSRIRCGTTGMSANNCTFQGGNVQVLVAPGLRQHMIFEGLSFVSASVTSNAIVAAQDAYGSLFEYRDCIFRVSGIEQTNWAASVSLALLTLSTATNSSSFAVHTSRGRFTNSRRSCAPLSRLVRGDHGWMSLRI